MPNKQAKTVINTFMNVVGSTFFDFKTITSDNGTEFAGHEAISKITEADFYFARPYRSCDRGLNEHTNGLIRRFLPKGTDFNEIRALLRKIIVSFRKVIFLCSLLRIKQLIQIIYQ
ncbi:IS30 family transposase [Piscirickettsia salmonis]